MDKAGLFREVIQDSAERVASAQIDLIDKHLHKIVDLEGDLVEFGVDWVSPTDEFAEHFAMVRQIQADASHIPDEVLHSWQQAGPVRVRRALAARFREFAQAGLLDITDADQAVTHFVGLITAEAPPDLYAARPTKGKLRKAVASGVHVFLHGYAIGQR